MAIRQPTQVSMDTVIAGKMATIITQTVMAADLVQPFPRTSQLSESAGGGAIPKGGQRLLARIPQIPLTRVAESRLSRTGDAQVAPPDIAGIPFPYRRSHLISCDDLANIVGQLQLVSSKVGLFQKMDNLGLLFF